MSEHDAEYIRQRDENMFEQFQLTSGGQFDDRTGRPLNEVIEEYVEESGTWTEPPAIRQATGGQGLQPAYKALARFIEECFTAVSEIQDFSPDRATFGKMWELDEPSSVKFTFYVNDRIFQVKPGCDWLIINRWRVHLLVRCVIERLLLEHEGEPLPQEFFRLALDKPELQADAGGQQ